MPLFSTGLQLGVFLRPGRGVSGRAGLGWADSGVGAAVFVCRSRAEGGWSLHTVHTGHRLIRRHPAIRWCPRCWAQDQGPNIPVSCFNPSCLWWQCPCLPAVSTLQQSGCCGDNEICFLPGPSSRARQSAAPCHGPAAGTSFLRRNQGPDPHQPSTARATQLQHRCTYFNMEKVPFGPFANNVFHHGITPTHYTSWPGWDTDNLSN